MESALFFPLSLTLPVIWYIISPSWEGESGAAHTWPKDTAVHEKRNSQKKCWKALAQAACTTSKLCNGCPLILKLKIVVDPRARKCISKLLSLLHMLWCNHFRAWCFSSPGCFCTVPSLFCWILSQDTNPPAFAEQMFPKNAVWKDVMTTDLSHSAPWPGPARGCAWAWAFIDLLHFLWYFCGDLLMVSMSLLPWHRSHGQGKALISVFPSSGVWQKGQIELPMSHNFLTCCQLCHGCGKAIPGRWLRVSLQDMIPPLARFLLKTPPR